MIYVYNRTKETHVGPNNYPIFRGKSILANPYTDIKDKATKALFVVKNREEALAKYSQYFDLMYASNIEFKKLVDEIYKKYKNGEDIYLECYCAPLPCHGNIIANKLQKRSIKETFLNLKKEKINK